MRVSYCVTLMNVIGAIGFGRTHWKCEHWLDRGDHIETHEK